MNRNIVVGIVVLAVVVAVGIAEVFFITNSFGQLREDCLDILTDVHNQTITSKQYDVFVEKWHSLREKGELLLPHADLYEINLRTAESAMYISDGSYKDAEAQLYIVVTLLEYVPHLITPDFQHIF